MPVSRYKLAQRLVNTMYLGTSSIVESEAEAWRSMLQRQQLTRKRSTSG
jgi:hypothetical protein